MGKHKTAAAADAGTAAGSEGAARRAARKPPPGLANTRRTQWVSQGVEALFAQGRDGAGMGPSEPPDIDVLIVGSGYGGAVAARRLAGLQLPADPDSGSPARPLKVVMLERGREYLAGAFPSHAADLPGHLRFTTPHGDGAKGRLDGLFDLRVGEDMTVVLANGVGGGSLINAGVMEFPASAVFKRPGAWPAGMPAYKALEARAQALRQQLGAAERSATDPVSGLQRSAFMQQLKARPVPITIALARGENSAGVMLEACIACGDCATGCNHGAKDSLDLNLLRQAQRQGLTLYSGATVSRIRQVRQVRRPGGPAGAQVWWEAQVWHTDAGLRKRMARGHWVRARRIILAAGALGSTEILLRSQTDELQFSKQLGRRFSGNGDVLATLFDASRQIGGVADEDLPAAGRAVGPTITSMIDLRQPLGLVVQDLAVPGPLRRLFEETATTTALLQQLDRNDETEHRSSGSAPDPMSVDPAVIDRSVALALIFRDTARGVMSAVPDDPQLPRDAGLRIAWQAARHDPQVQRAHDSMAYWLGQSPARPDGGPERPKQAPTGRLLPNPMWQLLPPKVAALLGSRPGPMISVHPLGGCRMAGNVRGGVVNRLGQVWDAGARAQPGLHDGLLVLDGAILPCALGINPALTIATLADVAMDALINEWQLQPPAAALAAPAPGQARPVYRQVDPQASTQPPAKTEVQVLERLAGWVDLPGLGPGKALQRWVELDLVYQPKALFPGLGGQARAAFTQDGHRLPVALDAQLSRLRIFATRGSPFDPARSDKEAEFVAPLALGSELHFFHREPSTASERECRALRAWLPNRGLRDTWQAVLETVSGRAHGKLNVAERWRQARALATRAGELRRFDYQLTLGAPSHTAGPFATRHWLPALRVAGSKRFGYTRRGNPWSQLMRMELSELAGLPLGAQRVLEVQPAYFAAKRLPLMRVVAQQDQPSALIDLMAFGAYLARVFINLHVWSMRKPDTAFFTPRPPQRLPGRLPGLPAPEVHQFKPDGARDDAEIRLTAYRQPKLSTGSKGPVLMIHGYSASGTSFAHRLLRPSLAAHLWRQGFEPWVLDLRTSCGMPSADRPYSFEEIALADIPAAFAKVVQATGQDQIDVVSHCMGSAMLSMTLQSATPAGPQTAARIRRWVMSQFGPRLRFSPANLLRAYLISYFREALPDYRYSLQPGDEVPGVDGDLYDRFINTLPYLGQGDESEFDVENPAWQFWCRRPWVGTRHRLDALIGRTFDARQVAPEVLDRIGDFFGPINLRTMSQPIFFAQMGEVSGAQGLEPFGRDAAPLLRQVPMLSLHGRSNGLADPETATLLREWADQRGLDLTQRCYSKHGHQDLLIGRDCAQVFSDISGFLDDDLKPHPENDCA